MCRSDRTAGFCMNCMDCMLHTTIHLSIYPSIARVNCSKYVTSAGFGAKMVHFLSSAVIHSITHFAPRFYSRLLHLLRCQSPHNFLSLCLLCHRVYLPAASYTVEDTNSHPFLAKIAAPNIGKPDISPFQKEACIVFIGQVARIPSYVCSCDPQVSSKGAKLDDFR